MPGQHNHRLTFRQGQPVVQPRGTSCQACAAWWAAFGPPPTPLTVDQRFASERRWDARYRAAQEAAHG